MLAEAHLTRQRPAGNASLAGRRAYGVVAKAQKARAGVRFKRGDGAESLDFLLNLA